MNIDGASLVIGGISIVSGVVCAVLALAGVLPWWSIAVALLAGPVVVGLLGFLFLSAMLMAWMWEGCR